MQTLLNRKSCHLFDDDDDVRDVDVSPDVNFGRHNDGDTPTHPHPVDVHS